MSDKRREIFNGYFGNCDANKMGGAALPSKCCWNENVCNITPQQQNQRKAKNNKMCNLLIASD